MRSVSTGEHAEYLPVGHSISLAARMQTLAPIGSIAIEIYGWFTEGLDTADLKDAKMLLEELS
jgi:hypothetical protein